MNDSPQDNESMSMIKSLQKRMEELEYKERLLTYENRRLTNENELLHTVRNELMNLLGEEMVKIDKVSKKWFQRSS